MSYVHIILCIKERAIWLYEWQYNEAIQKTIAFNWKSKLIWNGMRHSYKVHEIWSGRSAWNRAFNWSVNQTKWNDTQWIRNNSQFGAFHLLDIGGHIALISVHKCQFNIICGHAYVRHTRHTHLYIHITHCIDVFMSFIVICYVIILQWLSVSFAMCRSSLRFAEYSQCKNSSSGAQFFEFNFVFYFHQREKTTSTIVVTTDSRYNLEFCNNLTRSGSYCMVI